MQKVAIVASVAATSLATSGHMSVGGSLVGGSCEYANEADGGAKSPAATSPHVVSGRYCGVSAKILAGGAHCGACYNVSYSGEGGTNPGRAGWEVVQVVDSAGGVDFACNKDVFTSITGASTGTFPMAYHKIACEVDSAVGVATVLDGKNAYYTKAIFSDMPHAVSSAVLRIGKKLFAMDRVAGATFKANTDGSTASASFELTLADGSINKLAPCFKSWPVATDSSCAPAAVKAKASRRRANPCPTGGCPDRGTVGETCAANSAPCLTSVQPKPCCTPYTDNAAGWTIMDTCYEKTPGFNVCRKAGTCEGAGWTCKVIHGLANSNTTVV